MDSNENQEIIVSTADVLEMLDELLEKRDGEWWNNFYAERTRPVPFFQIIPDEELALYCNQGIFHKGRALDIGCGNGRNSFYLAEQGFDSFGIDISEESIAWAKEISQNMLQKPCFEVKSLFDFNAEANRFDLILDSGCFHHIKPHRREEYLTKIQTLLKEDGFFLMTCFNLDGGADSTDYDVYREYSMHGGLGFSEEKIKTILSAYFEIQELRRMKESSAPDLFGKSFLWVILMKKK